MREIFRTEFGSHLYGLATPSSDRDYKAVHLPSRRDLLLQRAKPEIQTKTRPSSSTKNTAEDVDIESFALHRFIDLVTKGQLIALDTLFATPTVSVLHRAHVWTEVWENRALFLNRDAKMMLGYCRAQSQKHSLKGERILAARRAVEVFRDLLDRHTPIMRLGDLEGEFQHLIGTPHVTTEDVTLKDGTVIRHLVVCGRAAPYTASLRNAADIFERIDHDYGERARKAARQDAIDWKAMSHAVRVGRESIEFLRTGFITFPLLERDHILKIKQGEVPIEAVAEEIDEMLGEVETAALRSELPEKVDHDRVDDFLVSIYEAL